jgi:hypothetical protein
MKNKNEKKFYNLYFSNGFGDFPLRFPKSGISPFHILFQNLFCIVVVEIFPKKNI